ncbi:MAG: hypothetical protein GC181_10615 [Bacteroidetes bacterium]|nr:hypothetical protein [Bacteroidota bacterium]
MCTNSLYHFLPKPSGTGNLRKPHHHPFGMMMHDRSYSNANKDYRFGFNGMERDDEVKGEGNSLDFGDRMYDTRLGRWLSLDPLQSKYPKYSPYNFVANNPVINVDQGGRDYEVIIDVANKTITIHAIFFVNHGDEKTKKLVQQAVNEINGQSGKYSLLTDEGETYEILFDLQVAEESGRGNNESWENDAGNLVEILDEKTYNRVYNSKKSYDEATSVAITLYGGDEIDLNENGGSDKGTMIHEMLHSLGLRHRAFKRNLADPEITKRVIIGILNNANIKSTQSGGDCSIDVNKAKLDDTMEGYPFWNAPGHPIEAQPPKTRIRTAEDSGDGNLKGKVKLTEKIKKSKKNDSIRSQIDIVRLETEGC